MDRSNNIPYAKELDFYVETEGLLELCAQRMTGVVSPHVHGIRERQLFEGRSPTFRSIPLRPSVGVSI